MWKSFTLFTMKFNVEEIKSIFLINVEEIKSKYETRDIPSLCKFLKYLVY